MFISYKKVEKGPNALEQILLQHRTIKGKVLWYLFIPRVQGQGGLCRAPPIVVCESQNHRPLHNGHIIAKSSRQLNHLTSYIAQGKR